MIQMTLSKSKVEEFSTFLAENKLSNFFIAKDEGAYIGATTVKNGQCISWLKYFRGCNPETDKDWRHKTYSKFGGDDFGEFFGAKVVHDMAKRGSKIIVRVTPSRIELVGGAG